MESTNEIQKNKLITKIKIMNIIYGWQIKSVRVRVRVMKFISTQDR